MIASTHRIATRRRSPRRLDGEGAFVVALDAYQHGGDAKAMLRSAAAIIDSKRPIAMKHADTISMVTDNLNLIVRTYGDAADEIWRRLAFSAPGARH
jgi:hypothetical protein